MCECLSICTLKCIPFRPFVCRFVWNSCVQADDVTSWRGLPPLADCRKHLHTWHIQQPIAIFFSSLLPAQVYLLLILEQTNTFIYTYTGPPFFLFGRKTTNKNRKNKSWEKRFFLLYFSAGRRKRATHFPPFSLRHFHWAGRNISLTFLSRNQIKINTKNKARICWRLCIVYKTASHILYTV